MDGWIELSGCGCGKWLVESGWKVDVESGKWIVARFRISQ